MHEFELNQGNETPPELLFLMEVVSPAPPIPLPSADQFDPSHIAIRLAAAPPAVVNKPPA